MVEPRFQSTERGDVIRVLYVTALLALLLTGCGQIPNSSSSSATVIYHNDGCLFYVDGLTLEQVREKEKDWEFTENCEVAVRLEVDD